MKTYLECYPCFLRHALEASKIAGLDEERQKKILNSTMDVLKSIALNASPPQIAKLIHRKIRELSGLKDPYRSIKDRQNSGMLKIEGRLKRHIMEGTMPIIEALKLAGSCNAIDMGPSRNWEEVDELLSELFSPDIGRFEYERFLERLKQTKRLLYIADNAGEIVGDKLMIYTLKEYKKDLEVVVAVRDKAVLNDATLQDAKDVGLDEVADSLITTGSDAPGAILSECSEEFLDTFKRADLIISKGQGNYEALDKEKREGLFFLLQIKCKVVSKDLQEPIGKIVLQESLST